MVCISEAHQSIVLRHKSGSLLRKYGQDELGITLLQDAARQGHPDACAELSHFYQKESKYAEALFWEEAKLAHEPLYYGSPAERPFARLYDLKELANR